MSQATPIKHRCSPDCARRTITCKFDGSCDEYHKFCQVAEELRAKTAKATHDERIATDVLISGRNKRLKQKHWRGW